MKTLSVILMILCIACLLVALPIYAHYESTYGDVANVLIGKEIIRGLSFWDDTIHEAVVVFKHNGETWEVRVPTSGTVNAIRLNEPIVEGDILAQYVIKKGVVKPPLRINPQSEFSDERIVKILSAEELTPKANKRLAELAAL